MSEEKLSLIEAVVALKMAVIKLKEIMEISNGYERKN